MKIKLAILEKDRNYLSRMVTVFGAKYADKLEIYSFTELEVAMETLKTAKIDLLLANDSFSVDVAALPGRCAFAYLVDSPGIDTVNDQRAICKFQKADLIYKQILSVYSEKAENAIGFRANGERSSLVIFSSAAGGVGCSTMAAACALHYAGQGKKTLYLNLEVFGSSDLFFQGEGMFDLSDVIFALKSKKSNLHIKLESCVKKDQRGVFFYSQPKLVLDRMELKFEEILRLLSELRLTGDYECIVMDVDFSLEKETLDLYRQAQSIVMVSDGSPAANVKTQRAWQALVTRENNEDAPVTDRMNLIYNRVSSKRGMQADIEGLRLLGGAPVYAGGTTEQILSQIAPMDMFDKLI